MLQIESDVLEIFFGAADQHVEIPNSVVAELRKVLSGDKVPNIAALKLAIGNGLKADVHVED